MTAAAPRKRTRLAPQARREQILDEAARLILEEGLHAVSMERLARDVGRQQGSWSTTISPPATPCWRRCCTVNKPNCAIAAWLPPCGPPAIVDLIRQTTRLYLEQTRDRGALINALLSDPSVARLMEDAEPRRARPDLPLSSSARPRQARVRPAAASRHRRLSSMVAAHHRSAPASGWRRARSTSESGDRDSASN